MHRETTNRFSALWAAAILTLAGCYESHYPDDVALPDVPGDCAGDAPQCVMVPDNPCHRRTLVAAVCDGDWQCPDASLPYLREGEGTCTAFPGLAGPGQVGEGGPGLPLVDTCAWVFERATFFDDLTNESLAVPSATGAFGACPNATSYESGTPLLAERPPQEVHSIIHAFEAGPETLVLFRQFARRDAAVFGVAETGTGFARWRPATRTLDPLPSPTWFAPDAFGNVVEYIDGIHYAFACEGAELRRDCRLARQLSNRISDPTTWSHWNGTDFEREDGRNNILVSGPHRSDIVFDASRNRFVHVFAEGFGRSLLVQYAPDMTGPWTDPQVLAACELPDESAFCSSPLIREELLDPTRPRELAVSYNVGTTNAASVPSFPPGAFWPRVTYANMP